MQNQSMEDAIMMRRTAQSTNMDPTTYRGGATSRRFDPPLSPQVNKILITENTRRNSCSEAKFIDLNQLKSSPSPQIFTGRLKRVQALQIVDQDEHLLISQPRNYNNRTTRFEDQSNKLLLAPAQERPIKFANRASPANFATQQTASLILTEDMREPEPDISVPSIGNLASSPPLQVANELTCNDYASSNYRTCHNQVTEEEAAMAQIPEEYSSTLHDLEDSRQSEDDCSVPDEHGGLVTLTEGNTSVIAMKKQITASSQEEANAGVETTRTNKNFQELILNEFDTKDAMIGRMGLLRKLHSESFKFEELKSANRVQSPKNLKQKHASFQCSHFENQAIISSEFDESEVKRSNKSSNNRRRIKKASFLVDERNVIQEEESRSNEYNAFSSSSNASGDDGLVEHSMKTLGQRRDISVSKIKVPRKKKQPNNNLLPRVHVVLQSKYQNSLQDSEQDSPLQLKHQQDSVKFKDDDVFFGLQDDLAVNKKRVSSPMRLQKGQKSILKKSSNLGDFAQFLPLQQTQPLSFQKTDSTVSIDEIKKEIERRLQRSLYQHEIEQVMKQEPSLRRAITSDWNQKLEKTYKRMQTGGQNLNAQSSLLKKKITNVYSGYNPPMIKQASAMQIFKRKNLLKQESMGSATLNGQQRGSSVDDINSQLMSSVSSEAFDAHFMEGYGQIGNVIKKTTKKMHVNVESASMAEYYNYMDEFEDGSIRSSNDSNQTLSLFSDSQKNSDKNSDDSNQLKESESEEFDEEEKQKKEINVAVNKFFDENIKDTYAEKIAMKTSRPEIKQLPQYDSFDKCVEALRGGIQVIKHNYTNMDHRLINLWLSDDTDTLCYKPINPPNKITAFFRGTRSLSFKNIKGFIYGPFSSTFAVRKKKVINAMAFKVDEDFVESKITKNQKPCQDDSGVVSDAHDSVQAKIGNVAYLDNHSEMSEYHKRLFMEASEYDQKQKDMAQTQLLQSFVKSDGMFYAWECVSLIMANSTTVDLVIKDNFSLMCLLHVLQRKLRHKNSDKVEGCLQGFKFLKAKMKLSYQCRKQDIEMADLFYSALYRSLSELRTLAVYKLRKIAAHRFIPDPIPVDRQSRDTQYFGKLGTSPAVIDPVIKWKAMKKQTTFNQGQKSSFSQSHDISFEESSSSSVSYSGILQTQQNNVKKGSPKENKLTSAERRSQFKSQCKLKQSQSKSRTKQGTGLMRLQNIIGRSNYEDGIISPRAFAKKITMRMQNEQRNIHKLLKITIDFINVTDKQLLYLNLIKEDQWNPFLEMVRINLIDSEHFGIQLNQSYKFYQEGHETRKMRQRHTQRVKLQVDFDDKRQTLMQLVQAKMMLNEKFLDRYGRKVVNKDKNRKRQISNMLAQVKQTYVLAIKNLEMDLIGIPNSMKHKRQKLAIKREVLRKELTFHEQRVKGLGRRINKYTRQQAHLEFLKVMREWRRVHRCIEDVRNVKFKADLRRFGNDFDMVKKQIKHCYLQKQELNKKARKYRSLFDSPQDEMLAAGISPTVLKQRREQFKQRFRVLKKALGELEEEFGIQITDKKLTRRESTENVFVAPQINDIPSKLSSLRRKGYISQSGNGTQNTFGEMADIHINILHQTFKEQEQRKLIGMDAREKVILYNPDQSLNEDNWSQKLNSISEFDIDEEMEKRFGDDHHHSDQNST